jgi:ABC-2 type transport system permease protein
MRYLKLLAIFLKSNLLVELEYRSNFIAQALLGVFWAGITFISVSVFFLHTDELGGWTYDQALVIVALFTLIDGAIQLVLQPNVNKVIQMIREGTMDFVLTKPVNSQFIATLRYTQYSGFADMATGILILLFAFNRMHYAPDAASLLQFVIMLAAALVIVYSIFVSMATLAFWFVRIDNLTVLFRTLYDTARFPVTTFSGLLRFALTFVLPIAFMTTFPAQAVLGKLDSGAMIAAFALATILFLFSAWFWRRAVRSYSSASS